jgi:dipeptidyl aminopeptidase/acylaminoacyl peptidase
MFIKGEKIMISIMKEIEGEVPFLHVIDQRHTNEKCPTIFFIHGFMSAKEHNLHYAYLLAERGFRVILPDCALHGERGKGFSENQLFLQFWNIVIRSINEIAELKVALTRKGYIDEERIGVVGTSMGGVITLGALTQYDWIHAAVSLMGSPTYQKFLALQLEQMEKYGVTLPHTEEELEEQIRSLAPFDLSLQPEKLQSRPLLFWHGKKDTTVPYQPTYDFYKKVKSYYAEFPEKICFITDTQAGHKVSREGLLETIAWFDHFLKGVVVQK